MFAHFLKKIADLASRHVDFLRKTFSDGGIPSMSRVMTIPHVIISCWAVVYIVLHTHGIGLDTLTGLGAFATVHYGVNRVTNIFTKKQQPQDDQAAKEQANG